MPSLSSLPTLPTKISPSPPPTPPPAPPPLTFSFPGFSCMAQLPPRAPTMEAQDLSWPDFQPPPPAPQPAAITAAPLMALDDPSWIDGFIEFSAAKRRAHRRSVSDSMAFLEEPMVVELRGPPAVHGGAGEFEKFEDEAQLIMSMFNNEMKETADGPATSSSGHGSSNAGKRRREEKPVKSEHEVESSTCKNDDREQPQRRPHGAPPVEVKAAPPPPSAAGSNEAVVDPKRVKRILANRQSAQRSRVRKLQYISELERSLTRLQTEVSMLSPRVAFLDHQRMILNVDNSALKAKIAALAQDKIFKDAHQEALKREIERLKQVYHQQSVAKAENIATTPASSPPSTDKVAQPP